MSRSNLDQELDDFSWETDNTSFKCSHIGDLEPLNLSQLNMERLCGAAAVDYEPQIIYRVLDAKHLKVQTGGRRSTHRTYKLNQLSVVHCQEDTLSVENILFFHQKYFALCDRMQTVRADHTRFPKFSKTQRMCVMAIADLIKPMAYCQNADEMTITVLNSHAI